MMMKMKKRTYFTKEGNISKIKIELIEKE